MKSKVLITLVMAVLLASGCATLPKDFERPASYALRDTLDTAWAIDLADEKAANPGKSGFHLLGQGKEAFLARAALIHYAERSIDVHTLHAKTFVLDRQQMFIGSLNLDPRSAVHNTEIGLVISCEELAQGFGEWFDRDIEKLAFRLELKESKGQKKILWHGLVDGQPATLTDEPHAGPWLKFKVDLFGILPIESQL